MLLALAVAIPVTQTGCSNPPSARVAQVQTLKAVGATAEASVALSAQLYAGGTINASQAREVMDFYDQKFQPVYRLAVASVNANLDSIASPDVLALATQLSALVLQFQHKK
jgi:hypothetical protein